MPTCQMRNIRGPKHITPSAHPIPAARRDDLTYDMIGKAFTAFATAVRQHDPHRLIFTGDSFPRLSAWHQEQEGSWKHDSMEQFAEMLTKANPDPISGISLHAYEDDDQRLDVAMAVRKLNKPIFVGEFGAQHETPDRRQVPPFAQGHHRPRDSTYRLGFRSPAAEGLQRHSRQRPAHGNLT